jgi:hypothetical protein
MYKSRFKKWGFDIKNNRKSTMFALKRKHLERGSRPTAFKINAREIESGEVDRFLKRRQITDQQVLAVDAPSPPGLQCRTPDAQTVGKEEDDQLDERFNRSAEAPGNATLLAEEYFRTEPLQLSPDLPVGCFIRSSDTWHMAECMAYDLRDYVSGAFESGLWVDRGTEVFSSYLMAKGQSCVQRFASSFSRAIDAFFAGNSSQAWVDVHIGFHLAKAVINLQDCRLPARFCRVVCMLQDGGHNQLADLLCQRFAQMSSQCFKGSSHPLTRTFHHFFKLRKSVGLDTALHLVESLGRVLASRIGPLHPAVLNTTRDLLEIKAIIYGFDSVEYDLRQECQFTKRIFGPQSPQHLRMLILLGGQLLQSKRLAEALVVGEAIVRCEGPELEKRMLVHVCDGYGIIAKVALEEGRMQDFETNFAKIFDLFHTQHECKHQSYYITKRFYRAILQFLGSQTDTEDTIPPVVERSYDKISSR